MNEFQIFVGLNDADTHRQELDKKQFIAALCGICRKYNYSFAVTSSHGGYFHDDGTFVEEKSLVITFSDRDKAVVEKIAKEICAVLNQEAVILTSCEKDVMTVKRETVK